MTTATLERPTTPRVDVLEDNDAVTILAELPGVSREDAQIEVHDGTLTLTANRGNADADGAARLRERSPGKYRRAFRLGKGLDVERIEASMNDGLLTLTLPKAEESKLRTVSIN